jgi:hypothetical protein
MTGAKWMIAARFGNRVMGRTGLGVAVFAPEENSAEWLAKEGLRRTADNCFYVGLVLTALAPTRELYPPAFVDGALVRLVTDAKVVGVEQWTATPRRGSLAAPWSTK